MPHLVPEWIWYTFIKARMLWEIGIKEGGRARNWEQNKGLLLIL